MLIGRECIDLGLCLIDSAQCFRWTRVGDAYGCVLNDVPVWLRATDDGITAEGDVDAGYLRHYLDLDRNYAGVAARYEHIPQVAKAVSLFPGLRVLNQPTWEVLIWGILSANNNVARIRALNDALAQRYGRAYDTNGVTLYGFPTPDRIANDTEAALRELRVGYRAPYLIGTARRVCEGFPLDALCNMSYDEAHAALVTLPGVGDKVADCVLLFGCGHTEAVPVDVWVARAMENWFRVTCKNRTEMGHRAREMMGKDAGLVQQFLFHAARTGAIEL